MQYAAAAICSCLHLHWCLQCTVYTNPGLLFKLWCTCFAVHQNPPPTHITVDMAVHFTSSQLCDLRKEGVCRHHAALIPAITSSSSVTKPYSFQVPQSLFVE